MMNPFTDIILETLADKNIRKELNNAKLSNVLVGEGCTISGRLDASQVAPSIVKFDKKNGTVQFEDGRIVNIYPPLPDGEPVAYSFTRTNDMSFGQALEKLKLGKKVARAGWNGKGMFLIYVGGTSAVEPRAGSPYADLKVSPSGFVDINPHIDMKTATGEMQPGWLASQTDMLADDWLIIE